MLVGAKAWAPVNPAVSLRLIRPRNLHEDIGLEERTIEGVRGRLTSSERTVIGCFRRRRTIGLDVALEALRDHIKRGHGNTDARWRIAKVLRM